MPRLKRQMGIIQWPARAFFIWKCREPGLGSIFAPPFPRNQISPVLHRIRASLLSRESMPMSPGTAESGKQGASNFSSQYWPAVSTMPVVRITFVSVFRATLTYS